MIVTERYQDSTARKKSTDSESDDYWQQLSQIDPYLANRIHCGPHTNASTTKMHRQPFLLKRAPDYVYEHLPLKVNAV